MGRVHDGDVVLEEVEVESVDLLCVRTGQAAARGRP